MTKKNIYNYFIGLLALILSIMIMIDLFFEIPSDVKWTFYYIDNIIRVIFFADLIVVFKINRGNKFFIRIIDIISLIPLSIYFNSLIILNIVKEDKGIGAVRWVQVFMVTILMIKFINRTKDHIIENRFNLLLALSTIIIVIGAVAISLIEDISIGDALWWSFVTFTTVGYGDVLLKTQLGRGVAVLLMMFGIGAIGVVTTSIALLITGDHKKKKKITYEEKIINEVKNRLTDYESLSEEEIDNISNILKTFRKK